jgi:hypothetical protein
MQCSSGGCSLAQWKNIRPWRPELGPEGKFVSEIFHFFYFWGEAARGGGAQRSVWHVNVPKKTDERSARARTHGQNPLLVSVKATFKIWPNQFILAIFLN